MTKIVAIVNPKGGTGKTTTSLMLSYHLASVGKKILLIDADPKADLTRKILGADKTFQNGLYESVFQKKSLEEYIVPTEIVNVFLVPGNMNLVGFEIEKLKASKREVLLKRKLSSLKSDFDIVFIDCPSSLGVLTVNCLSASHSAVIPLLVDNETLEGVGKLLNTIKIVQNKINPELSINGFLLSIIQNMSTEQESIFNKIKIQFKGMLYDTIIQRDEKVEVIDSYAENQRIFSLNLKTLETYKAFADEYLLKNCYG